MTVSPEENVRQWEAIVAKSKRGAAPTATAMAKHIAEHAAKVTLARTKKPSGAWHRARPGEPPSMGTGKLAEAMYWIPASRQGGTRASAYVRNSLDYSRTMEFGCVVDALSRDMLHWKDSGSPVKGWFHDRLKVPPHPFMAPATEEVKDDGSLRDAAIEAFTPYDP